ncbi:MAG: methyltransferase domain-containing protein [Cyanobacteria bacterium J06627_28]
MAVKRTSYSYDTFEREGQVQEFERLYHQASVLLETERELWPSMNIVAGQSVLDVGCGAGIVTHELAKQVYPAQATGIDLSHSLLRHGQSTYACVEKDERSAQTVFHQGSVYELPFPQDSFDIVYARLLFQHLSEPLQALENIWRVLKPGGRLCVLDIDKDWSSLYPEPDTPVQLDRAIVEKQVSEGGDPWVGRKLGSYLRSSGFEKVKTNISLIDSDQLGLSNYFGMLSFGRSYQAEDSQFAAMREEVRPALQALLDGSYAWAGFGLFVVTGQKIALH